jgi:hypothetical protein
MPLLTGLSARLPTYVPRDLDEELRSALKEHGRGCSRSAYWRRGDKRIRRVVRVTDRNDVVGLSVADGTVRCEVM